MKYWKYIMVAFLIGILCETENPSVEDMDTFVTKYPQFPQGHTLKTCLASEHSVAQLWNTYEF